MHRLSFSFKILFLSFLFLFLSACSDSKPTKVIVSFVNDLQSNSMDINRTISMKVYANYSDGTSSEVTSSLLWKSSDTSVATVSQGLITSSDKLGETLISYETVEKTTEGEALFEGNERLSIERLLLTAINISPSSVSLYEGTRSEVVATGTFINSTGSEISQQNITDDCLWRSDSESIATVDAGVIQAVSEGNTTITASDANLSAVVSVSVQKIHITKIEIIVSKQEFNVAQTIAIVVEATMDTGETTILNSSDLLYENSDTSIVTLDANIATAVAKGNAIVTVSLLLDSSFSDTVVLTVLKENYVRLFKGDVEWELSYDEKESYETLPENLDTFTLRAVGEDATVNSVNVKDFNGNILLRTVASFDNLESGAILYKDENRTFTLVHNGTQKELEYSFDIGTTEISHFTQRYEAID